MELPARRCSYTLAWPRVPRPTFLVESRSSDENVPTRSRSLKARLRSGVWVILDMSTKRRGPYIAYTLTRAAGRYDAIVRQAPEKERG